jgi:hypothetical protein
MIPSLQSFLAIYMFYETETSAMEMCFDRPFQP